MNGFDALLEEITAFRDGRDWRQFHTVQHLSSALLIEAAELKETLLWKSEAEISELIGEPDFQDRLSEELADVMIYALLLADRAGINLMDAVREKVAANERKYPADLAKGNARKYTELVES